MNTTCYISNAVLWGAAILASAFAGAPSFLTVVLLPALAASALFATRAKNQLVECTTDSPRSR